MKRRSNNRGSAVLMVVGLLTILTLLGSAFLVVTYMDRQQSRAAAARSQVDPGVQGFASMVTAAALNDLYISTTTGVYGDAAAGALGWVRVIDWCPSGNTAVDGNYPDTWLSPYVYSQFGAALAGAGIDVDGNSWGNGSAIGDSNVLVPLYPLGVYNTLGDAYYVAARFMDASGLVCTSTAGSTDPNFRSPARTGSSVGLQVQGLSSGAAGALVSARAGGQSLQVYDVVAGQRLLQPDGNFAGCMPFAIGDEMYLRWLKTPASTETGRLYQAVGAGGLSLAVRRLLTTYSVSDVRMPRPAAGYTARIIPAVASDANAQTTYLYVREMLRRFGMGGDELTQKKMAACFVANLQAYQDAGSDDSGGPWAFKPTAESFTAYGLTQRLVITEAYAAHKSNDPSGTNPPSDYAWGCAVELFNPTSQAIKLSDYELDANGNSIPLPGGNVPAGGKVVLVNFEKGSGSAMTRADLGLPTGGPVTGLTFLGDSTLTLVRVYGAVKVPVDQVSTSDSELKYHYASETSFTMPSTVSRDICRDDAPARAKYNMALYKQSIGDGSIVANLLDKPKAFGDADLDADSHYGAPIDRSDANQAGLVDIGEMDLVYLIGPMLDESSKPHFFPQLICGKDTSVSLGKLVPRKSNPAVPSPARLDPVPRGAAAEAIAYNYNGYAPIGNMYPDVPAGCLLSQFFNLIPPDPTRGDPVPLRVYGRINVNTASRLVLASLPFPAYIDTPMGVKAVDPFKAADYIIAYRDKKSFDGRNYADRAAATGSGLANLRGDTTAYPGMGSGVTVGGAGLTGGPFFLTPDEVAIPLADYANSLMTYTDYSSAGPTVGTTSLSRHRDYLKARDSIWRPVSNLITVNTGAAVANVYIQVGSPKKYGWNYIVAVDRSNCALRTDLPAVTLFAEVR